MQTIIRFLLVLLFFNGFLSASAQPLLSAVGATASSSYPGYPPSLSIDGSTNTFWSSGVGAVNNPHIEIDYGSDKQLSLIELVVNQWPNGQTYHAVSGRTSSGSTVNLGTFSSMTYDGQTLSLPVSNATPVRYVQIQTTVSPSWVGWYEIRAYGVVPAPTISGELNTSALTCVVPNGATSCNVWPTLSASVSSGGGRVWVASAPAGAPELGGWVFDTNSVSSTPITWIRQGTYAFELRAGTTASGTVLKTVTITGVPAPVITACQGASTPAATIPATQSSAQVSATGVTGTVSVAFLTYGDAGVSNTNDGWQYVTPTNGQAVRGIPLTSGVYAPVFGSYITYTYLLPSAGGNWVYCGTASFTRTAPPPTINPNPKNFSYFYVGDAYSYVGATGNNNYSSSISDHTNLAWVYVDPSDMNSVNALKSFINALPASVNVILNGPMFFGLPFANQPAQFLSNYQTNWNDLVGPGGLSATQYQRISAIYLVDEPEMNDGITDAQLATARALVHSVRPSGSSHTPALATTYSYNVTLNQPTKIAVGIASVDWLGFNCYPISSGGTWDNCYGTSMPQQLANLKLKRTSPSTQKIMLVAETAIARNFSGDPVSAARREQAIANLKLMRNAVISDSDLNGIVAFNFEGVSGGFGWAGASVLSDVLAASKSLGKCVIGSGVCNY